MPIRILVLAWITALLPLENHPVSAQAGRASIEGAVTATGTGTPLAGAQVTLSLVDAGNRAPTSSPPAATGNEGRFVFTGVPPGEYQISVTRDGFIPQRYGQRGIMGRGTIVSIGPGQRLRVDFQMAPAGVISGRVFDERGEPLAGATVQARTYRYRNGKRTLELVAPIAPAAGPESFRPVTAVTDDRGDYRLFWLPPGEYYVSVTAPRRYARSSVVDLDAPVARGPGFPDAASLPEPLYPAYFPGAIDPGAASPVLVPAGAEVPGIDFSWQPVRMPSIRGSLVVPVPPPADATRGRGPQTQGGTMVLSRVGGGRVTVAGQGGGNVFEFRGVEAGSYYVNAVERRNDFSFFGRARVEIGDADVDNVVVTLAPARDVRGTIELDADPPQPLRMDQLYVSITDTTGIGGSSSVQVGEDGVFTLRNVLPAEFRLSVTGLPPGSYLAEATFGSDDVLSDGFAPSGDPAILRLQVRFATGRVGGTVVDLDGRSYSGALVTLIPEESKRRRADLYFASPHGPGRPLRVRRSPGGNLPGFCLGRDSRRRPPGSRVHPAF